MLQGGYIGGHSGDSTLGLSGTVNSGVLFEDSLLVMITDFVNQFVYIIHLLFSFKS